MMEPRNRLNTEKTRTVPRHEWWWRGLALFLTVVGARFWLIAHYSTAMPFWDQWDGIGALILKPWLEGRLDWHAFFVPHNEHRIVLTRLLSLAVFVADGQWDNLVECAANTLFVGISAVCLAGVLTSLVGHAHRRLVFLAVGVYFVLPFGWENTLSGFQSQNYFLIFFSILAIWGLGFRRPGSWQWCAGLASLALACMSMATGFLAAVATGAALTVRLLTDRRRPGLGETVTLFACLAATVIGWVTRTEVPAHAVLRAEGFVAFVVATLRYMAWPTYQFPPCGLLAVVPLALVAVVALRRVRSGKPADGPAAGWVLALGFWVLLQTAAMAYGRGAQSAHPACRYMDLLALGPLFNLLAWVVLADGMRGVRKTAVLAGAVVWTGWLVAGLWNETAKDFRGWLPGYRDQVLRAEQNLQGYLATNDFQRYMTGERAQDLPYPIAERLAALLDDTLRPVLPADLQPPLVPKSVEFEGGGFVSDDHPGIAGRAPRIPWWISNPAGDSSARGKMRATFVSRTILPYLRFSFAGDLGEEGLRFTLSDPASGRQSDWRPVRHIGAHWQPDDLRKPGQEFVVTAVDESATGWFAFGAPVEEGFWSRWSGFALRRGLWLMGAGIFLACLGELAGVVRRRRNTA